MVSAGLETVENAGKGKGKKKIPMTHLTHGRHITNMTSIKVAMISECIFVSGLQAHICLA